MKYNIKNIITKTIITSILMGATTGCGMQTQSDENNVTDITQLVENTDTENRQVDGGIVSGQSDVQSAAQDVEQNTGQDNPISNNTIGQEAEADTKTPQNQVTEVASYDVYADKVLGYALSYVSNWDKQEKENGVSFKNDEASVTVTVSRITNENYTLDTMTNDAIEILYQGGAYVRVVNDRIGSYDAKDLQYIIDGRTQGDEIIALDKQHKLAYILNLAADQDKYNKYKSTLTDIKNSFKLIKIEATNSVGNTNTYDNQNDIGEILDSKIASENPTDIKDAVSVEETTQQGTAAPSK